MDNFLNYRHSPIAQVGTESKASNIKELLVQSNLDWTVGTEPVCRRITTGKDGDILHYEEVPNKLFTVREDTGDIIGVVSKSYEIVRNSESFSVVDDLLKNKEVKLEKAGNINNKKIWVCTSLPIVKVLKEEILPYLVFFNSHDGKGSVKVAITPTRTACQNVINMAFKNAYRSWSMKHLQGVDGKLQEVQQILNSSEQYMKVFTEAIGTLADTQINRKGINLLLDQVFPVNEDMSERQIENVLEKQAEVLDIYNNAPDITVFKGTAYGALLAISDYASHPKTDRMINYSPDKQFLRVVEGHPVIDTAYKILTAA